MKTKKQIQVVVIEPGRGPEIRMIDNTIKAKQEIVGGLIQQVPVKHRRYTIWVNEEGGIRHLPFNRRCPYDAKDPRMGSHDLFGTILLAQSKSMTDEVAAKAVEEWTE